MKKLCHFRKKVSAALLAVALCLLWAGCAASSEPNEAEKASQIPSQDAWVPILTVETSTPEGATVLFRQPNELKNCIVLSGNDYVLERYEDGTWTALPTLKEEVNFITGAFVVTAIPREEVDWQWLYGTLEAGRYRIGKQVTLQYNTQVADSATVYGEFILGALTQESAAQVSSSAEASLDTGEETVKKDTQKPTTSYTYQADPPSYHYSPLTSLPDSYSRDEAEEDRVVILLDGNAVVNQNVWEAFVSRTGQGISATVRCLDQDSRAGTQQIYDVSYDGTFYTLHRLENGSEKTTQFKHMLHFEEDRYSSAKPSHRYVLTMESGVTWEDIQWSMVNRDPNDGIAHQVVYRALSYHPIHPPIPDSSRVVLSLRGQELISVTGTDAERLTELFSKAEALTQRPDMNYTALDLVFYGNNGTVTTVWLNLYGDSFLCDGTFYAYSTDAMFDILDIETWPEEVLFAFPE